MVRQDHLDKCVVAAVNLQVNAQLCLQNATAIYAFLLLAHSAILLCRGTTHSFRGFLAHPDPSIV